MKTIGILMAALLAASVAWAGVNGGVRPYVRSIEGAAGAAKDAPYVEVRVGGSGFGAVQAVHVDLEYDPSGVEYVGFEAGDLFDDPLVLGPFDREDRHVVDVTAASLAGVSERTEGSVGVFRFRVLDGARSSVRLVSFQTADDSWQAETQVSYANPVGVSGAPWVTRLLGNAPNPFNPVTEVRFSLSTRGAVRLEVYNVSGRLVRTLARGVYDAGAHAVTWDGRDAGGAAVSSGAYFYRLQTKDVSESKRMTLIR